MAALDRLRSAIQNSVDCGPHYLNDASFVGFLVRRCSRLAESPSMDPRIAAVAQSGGSAFAARASSRERPSVWLHSDFSRQVCSITLASRTSTGLINTICVVERPVDQSDSHLFLIRGSFHESFVDPSQA